MIDKFGYLWTGSGVLKSSDFASGASYNVLRINTRTTDPILAVAIDHEANVRESGCIYTPALCIHCQCHHLSCMVHDLMRT